MNNRVRERLLAVLAIFAIPSIALAASPNWENVASYEGKDGSTYFAQIDYGSIAESDGALRFWIRLVKGEKGVDPNNPYLKYRTAASGPSLYELRCEQGQLRLMQGGVILGYAGPMVPLDRPASWEYVVPGSLGQLVHQRLC